MASAPRNHKSFRCSILYEFQGNLLFILHIYLLIYQRRIFAHTAMFVVNSFCPDDHGMVGWKLPTHDEKHKTEEYSPILHDEILHEKEL